MTDQHYEWAVIGPDGKPISGIFTMGPHGPRDEMVNGVWRQVEDAWGEPQFTESGEPVMQQRVPPAPEGSYVGRRLITRSDWEPADEALYPPKGSIRPGQVWQDNDRRAVGQYLRYVKIIDVRKDHVLVEAVRTPQFPSGERVGVGKTRKIRIDRMRPTSTGYRLVAQSLDS